MAKRQHAQNQARIAAAKAAEAAAANGENGEANGDNHVPAPQPPPPANPGAPRHAWEHVDEIMAILKTAFPLLALSMEMIVDQISTRFKPSPEEDIFRLITALLSDSLQQFIARASQPQDDGLLAQATITNIARFAENLHPIGVKVSLESVESVNIAALPILTLLLSSDLVRKRLPQVEPDFARVRSASPALARSLRDHTQ